MNDYHELTTRLLRLHATHTTQVMKEIAEVKAMLSILLQLQRDQSEAEIEAKLEAERARYKAAMQVTTEQMLRLLDPDVDE